MRKSLIDVAKHQNKLRAIIALNLGGAYVFTEKTNMALEQKVSRSEFIEAFRADIDKTATYLVDSLGIITSIKNGFIQELDALDNSVEAFFGETYKDGVVTLSGVEFSPGMEIKKAEIVDNIYSKLFNIDKKELSILAKLLLRYEESKLEVERTLLYPATIKVDEIISQMGLINHNFSKYTKSLSYDELSDFTKSFNRSGIEDVIQNSTYIDKDGVIRQAVHKNLPVLSSLSELIKKGLKYIEAIEIDGDADPSKVLRVVSQIERLQINVNTKFTLKLRKLGNYNARGLYMSSANVVAEDVRDSSALLHEIAHCIHLSNENIYNSKFVNCMIDKLAARVDFTLLPELEKKAHYYTSREEVIARALEIAALLENENSRVIWSDDDFDLIKSRSHYEEFEGIYFNFNSFDEKTIEEMSKLWQLFYATSYGAGESAFDNFTKIDTAYEVKQMSLGDTIKALKRLENKKQKELFSLVNKETIDLIIDRAPKEGLSLQDLAFVLFENISLWGGMAQRMMLDDWRELLENEYSVVFMKLIDSLKKRYSSKEYLDILDEYSGSNAFRAVENLLFCDGFSMGFRIRLKAELSELPNWSRFRSFRNALFNYGPMAVVKDEELLGDIEFLKEYYTKGNGKSHTYRIKDSGLFSEEVYMEIYKYIYESNRAISYLIPKSIVEIFETPAKEEEEEAVEETDKDVVIKDDEVSSTENEMFEELIKEAKIVDFEHTQTGEKLKVMKIGKKLADFRAFNSWLKKSGIGYYSKHARGFIVTGIEKLPLASVAAGLTVYSQDLLDTFATGKLF